MTATIGIDVGGTKIAAGVVDEDGTIIARRTIATEAGDPRAIVAGITKVAQELLAAAPAVTGVGVGAAGLVDVTRGIVLSAPNIAWQDVHLRAMLEDRLGLGVAVDNDANVAALGEALYGAGVGVDDQVMITVGTGIGGGIIIGGKLYRGGRGRGGEIGHILVAGPDAPQCACGVVGCFEAVASGNAIGRDARARAHEPAAKAVLDLADGDVEAITGELVGRAAQQGDAFAIELLAEAGRWLGLGMASLVNLLDPDLFVIGGGAVRDGDLLLEPARASLAACVLGQPERSPPPVVPAKLGNDAGLVGAAALARAALRPV